MDPTDLARTFILALAVWREARGEPMLGKLLVAQVIENRVADPRWPDTYEGVVFQPWQFSSFTRGDPQALAFPDPRHPVWADCVAVATMIVSSPGRLTDANHFHATGVSPAWAIGQTVLHEVGRHRFYRL